MGVINLTDWVIDKEIAPLFVRVSEHVDLQGAYTPDEIHERFRQKIKHYKFFSEKGYCSPKKYRQTKENLEKLIENDFGSYVIAHARRHPDQIVSLTLHYGRDKARDILLERHRRLRRTLRVRAIRRIQVPR
jgi:hypothetical protein